MVADRPHSPLRVSTARLLLIALLTPMLIATMPGVAQADVYSEPGTAAIDYDGFLPGDYFTCNVTAFNIGKETTTQELAGAVACDFGWNIVEDSVGNGSLIFSGNTADGNYCEADVELSGTLGSLHGLEVGSTVTKDGLSVKDCTITEVCMSGSYDTEDGPFTPNRNTTFSDCSDVLIAAPPPHPATCPNGTPIGAFTKQVPHPTDPQYHGHDIKITFRKGVTKQAPNGSWGWTARLVSTTPNGSDYKSIYSDQLQSWSGSIGAGRAALTGGNLHGHENDHTLLGIQVGWLSNTGTAGKTDPAACTFWFGPKIGATEPQGTPVTSEDQLPPSDTEVTPPVVEPPPPPPKAGTCTFKVSDPTTWATAGICALVELMRAVLDVLGGIVSGILNGLKALFIPSDGFLEGKINALDDSLDGSTLGNYLDVLGDLAPSGGSGCAGPEFRIDAYGMGGGSSAHPMSACSGSMAALASTSRLILSCSIALGAGLACIRILGRGFGWDPGIGGGAST